MPRKTKEEAAKTREKIMRTAEQVFFDRGVVRTSLQEIAVAAGVTRGAVYWHFKDKVDLLWAIADSLYMPHEDLLDRLIAMDSSDPLALLCENCCATMESIMNNAHRRRVYTILTKRCEYDEEMSALNRRNDTCRDRLQEKIEGIFKQAEKRGLLSKAWTPRSAAIALQAMVLGFIHVEMEYAKPSRRRDNVRNEAIVSFFKALRAGP